MIAPKRRAPADLRPVSDEDRDGPSSAVRPRVPLLAVPWLAVTVEGLRSLPLDARAAYLLSLVDGECNVETVLDVCESELARDEALRILARLIQLGAIELRRP